MSIPKRCARLGVNPINGGESRWKWHKARRRVPEINVEKWREINKRVMWDINVSASVVNPSRRNASTGPARAERIEINERQLR